MYLVIHTRHIHEVGQNWNTVLGQFADIPSLEMMIVEHYPTHQRVSTTTLMWQYGRETIQAVWQEQNTLVPIRLNGFSPLPAVERTDAS